MKDEITAAVLFLLRLIEKNKCLTEEKMKELEDSLKKLLAEKYHDHWFPEKPFKGQAFRCLRLNEKDRRDGTLEKACKAIGIRYEDVRLPVELTLWVDPEEVTCRFGEHKGTVCVIASFKDGNKENFMDSINIEELEQRSLERAKQASFELVRRKKAMNRNGYSKNGYQNGGGVNGLYSGLEYGTGHGGSTYYSPHPGHFYGSSPKYGPFGSSPPPGPHSLHSSGRHSQSLYSAPGGFPVSPPNRGLGSTPYRGGGLFSGNGTGGSPGYGVSGGKPLSRGLNSAFNNAAMSSFSSYPQASDRYHWMNKSIVKA